nr:MAG TPA: YopX protein [Caudoviricetes sp.]
MVLKFRAWDKKLKKMFEVSFIDFDTKLIGLNIDLEIIIFDFDDVNLMQSTGLLDKNGKEIFVGDIIKCTRGCPHEVYLEKEYGGTYVGGMPAIYLKGIREGYAWTGAEEILGNIYENPELLEVE